MSPTGGRPPRRFQFGIQSLLWLTVAVAIACAYGSSAGWRNLLGTSMTFGFALALTWFFVWLLGLLASWWPAMNRILPPRGRPFRRPSPRMLLTFWLWALLTVLVLELIEMAW